jgi:hypothetical protein
VAVQASQIKTKTPATPDGGKPPRTPEAVDARRFHFSAKSVCVSFQRQRIESLLFDHRIQQAKDNNGLFVDRRGSQRSIKRLEKEGPSPIGSQTPPGKYRRR